MSPIQNLSAICRETNVWYISNGWKIVLADGWLGLAAKLSMWIVIDGSEISTDTLDAQMELMCWYELTHHMAVSVEAKWKYICTLNHV